MVEQRTDYYTFPKRYGIIHSLEVGLKTLGGRLIEGSNHQLDFENLEMMASISMDDNEGHIILELKRKIEYLPRRFGMLFGFLRCDGHYSADDLDFIIDGLEGIGALTVEDMRRIHQ